MNFKLVWDELSLEKEVWLCKPFRITRFGEGKYVLELEPIQGERYYLDLGVHWTLKKAQARAEVIAGQMFQRGATAWRKECASGYTQTAVPW